MSEIPNAAKGAAREKMREAKARGETLKYTDALASVLDAETVEQSPKTQLVSRLRAALNHLNEALRDNPCFTDETRRQARTVVTNIIRTSDGKSNRVFPICIRGYKSTGGYRLAAGIYNALVKGGVVPEAEPVSFRGENDLSDMCLKGEHPTFLIMRGDYAQESEHHLDNISLFLFRSGETRCETNAVTFVMVGVSDDFDHVFKGSTNRIRTHLPSKKGETAQIYAEHELGYVLTSNALKEFEDAMDAVQGRNDRHFYDKVSWIDVVESIVNRAVDVHLDKLIAKDTDSFDTNIYAEDINQAAKDMFFVNYGPAMADENVIGGLLELVGAQDIDTWVPSRDTTNPIITVGTRLDMERCIPTHDKVEFPLRGDGNIIGSLGSGYLSLVRNLVVSTAAGYSTERVQFAILDQEGGSLNLGDLPHVVLETDNAKEFCDWLACELPKRRVNENSPELYLIVVGTDNNRHTRGEVKLKRDVDRVSVITVSQLTKDCAKGWVLALNGSEELFSGSSPKTYPVDALKHVATGNVIWAPNDGSRKAVPFHMFDNLLVVDHEDPEQRKTAQGMLIEKIAAAYS